MASSKPPSKTPKVTFISSSALETWDWNNPWTKGIGGSETSHIEMVERLGLKGFNVISYAPIASTKVLRGPANIPWHQHTQFKPSGPGVYIFYRNPNDLDHQKGPGQKWWFVAQDVDYPDQWTPSRMTKVDRYICLCKEHANFTARKYPVFKDRIYISANGIRSEYIKRAINIAGGEKAPLLRNSNRMFFPSSPDRGLKFLLEQWWRIREINPKAELRVAYGFNNMEKIWGADPTDWRRGYQGLLTGLLKQDGVTFMGRLNQNQVYAEWLQTGVWAHPTDFPESSPLHGDTLIDTLSGRIPIKNLVGKTFWLYSCDARGDLTISKAQNVKCTRHNAEVIRITYKPGRGCKSNKLESLVLTPDHEVMLRDGSYLAAGKLRVGDRLKAFHRQKNGWGDGYDMIGATDREAVPEHQFVFTNMNRPLFDNEIIDHVDGNKRNNEPENLEAKTQAHHAHDHWYRKTGEEKLIHAELFRQNVCRMTREEKSNAAYKAWETKREKALSNHEIVSIESAGYADVYCMEVPLHHNFVANNIFVHNCITCMEAQACGAWPVTNKLWALEDNVKYGYMVDGVPQNSALIRQNWMRNLEAAFKNNSTKARREMQEWALEYHNWDNIIQQWAIWIEQDVA